jgi:hypothetical protein
MRSRSLPAVRDGHDLGGRRKPEGRQCVHEFAPLVERVAAPVGPLGLVANCVRQCDAVGNSVTRADSVMADWAAFLAGESECATVVPIRGKPRKRCGVPLLD